MSGLLSGAGQDPLGGAQAADAAGQVRPCLPGAGHSHAGPRLVEQDDDEDDGALVACGRSGHIWIWLPVFFSGLSPGNFVGPFILSHISAYPVS